MTSLLVRNLCSAGLANPLDPLCLALGSDVKKVMAAKNDEQDERNMREQSQLRTELQALRQDSERAQSDLKNKMEREDKALNNDLRDLTKQTREALEDDLHTLGPHHLCSPRQHPSSRISHRAARRAARQGQR